MCITKVGQPGNFLNVQFGIIDFFVFCKIKTKLAQLGVAQLRRLDCRCFENTVFY